MSGGRNRRKARPWWKARRSRRGQRWALFIVALSVGGAGWAAYDAYREVVNYPQRRGSGSGEEVVVSIPRGASFSRVLSRLEEHGILGEGDRTAFKIFVLHKGAANKVRAGEHRLRGDMTPSELLEALMEAPPVEELRVTIPEGKHMLQVAAILADAGLGRGEDFVAAMRDRTLLDELGIAGPSIEGYLFPDTYRFRRGAEPKSVLTRLVQRHRSVYSTLRREHREAARRLKEEMGWGPYEIVTLASIVEKETGFKPERPRIAGVFLNRLRFSSFKPKLLQTDPTIIYGCTVDTERSEACKKFEGRIRRIHLRDQENRYSTYAHEGLPPGPISNPGRAALEAVLAPEKSRFLYFVARNDGTHKFSKSRAEHEAAVDKYIRGGAVGDGSDHQD